MTMPFDTLTTDELLVVEELDLSYQNLEEIPVKQLKENLDVIYLELACNRIRTLDGSLLEYLHNIIHLDLSNNQLSCLPDNFGCLTKLQHLDISYNEIKCLPISFSKLQNLVWLKISGNPLMPILKAIAKRETWDSDEYYSCARNIVSFMQQVDDSQNSIPIDTNSQIVPTKLTHQVNTDIEVLFNRAKPPMEKRNKAQTHDNEAMLVEDKSGNYFYVSLGKKMNNLAPYAKSFQNFSKEDKSSDLVEEKPKISTLEYWFKQAVNKVAIFSFMMLLTILFFSLTCHPKRFKELLLMFTYPSSKWWFLDYVQKMHSYLFNKFSSFSSVFPVSIPLPPPPILTAWETVVQRFSDLYYSWFVNWHYNEEETY